MNTCMWIERVEPYLFFNAWHVRISYRQDGTACSLSTYINIISFLTKLNYLSCTARGLLKKDPRRTHTTLETILNTN